MVSLNEREKYCLALIITRGGQASYEQIRDTILESRESFGDLSEHYLRYQAISRSLHALVDKGYLSEKKDVYRINSLMEVGFVQQFPIMISKAIKSNLRYRREHILEFNTSQVENYLLNEDSFVDPPYGLIENLKEALKLHKMESCDMVLVKCGKCVEIMTNELDDDFSLFDKDLSTGSMINQLRNTNIADKMNLDRDDLRTFVDGISVIYRFRNIMGAHEGWDWGKDQVATSCLVLTFYLVDLYMTDIRMKGR